MALIEWSDKFSVRIKQIDDQHKKLVSITNELYEAMKTGQAKEVMGNVLSNLISYTKSHFSMEEQLMAKYGYADLAAHKKVHEELTRKVMELKQKQDSGSLSLSIETSNFLKSWLINHIQKTDMNYSGFLNGKGVQ